MNLKLENENWQMHFDLKLQELQNNLDMWRARDNTLFEAVLIIAELRRPEGPPCGAP